MDFFTTEQKDIMFFGMARRHGPDEAQRMLLEVLLPHRLPEWHAYFAAIATRESPEKVAPKSPLR